MLLSHIISHTMGRILGNGKGRAETEKRGFARFGGHSGLMGDSQRLAIGGEGGIRTHGELTPTTVFETVPIDHSGTSPQQESTGRERPAGRKRGA